MRHRIVSGTGLGNPDKVILDNTGNLLPEFAEAAVDAYFFGGFDYTVSKDEVKIGIEPAYQYEKLKIVSINRDKGASYLQTGKSWGGYGSQIVKTTRFYKDYKNKSKFVKFVDKWHSFLFGDSNESK